MPAPLQASLGKRVHHPLSVDCVVFGPYDTEMKLLLIMRNKPPYKGKWALPGGFLEGNETLEEAAIRELQEETGISEVVLKQFHTFSAINRDPRGRVISTAFWAIVIPDIHHLNPSADAEDAQWFPFKKLPPLAFDHQHIIQKAYINLKQHFITTPLAFDVLPPKFTLTQLQNLYEIIFNHYLDKRNFRKKILKIPFIKETRSMLTGKRQRPSKLYTFDYSVYKDFESSGHRFDLF